MAAEVVRYGQSVRDAARRPYFLAYEIADSRSVKLSADLGAIVTRSEDRQRSVDVDLRVGEPSFDNTHPTHDGRYRSHGAHALVPREDGPQLAFALWRVTDEAHRDALEELAELKGKRRVEVAEAEPSVDLTREAPTVHIESLSSTPLDVDGWEARLKRVSRELRSFDAVIEGTARLSLNDEVRYFASSEGSLSQTSILLFDLSLEVEAIADDGMRLSLSERFHARSADRLPSEAALIEVARKLGELITQLRVAPLAEPYQGPAILEGEAAGVFFHEVFGHRVEGHRIRDESEGQTFAKQIGHPVMPSFLSVSDDPRASALEGIELSGTYFVDDEGIAAQRVTLVDHGVLKGFLLSRAAPTAIGASNGHGRRSPGNAVVARQGNLLIEPQSGFDKATLRARLLDEIRRQGKPYGLVFRKVVGGYTTTRRSDTQAIRVHPVVVYRVFPDGREELLRGVDFEGTPLAMLSKIVAAGDRLATFNGVCGAESGWVPVSASSPDLLFGEIEITRKDKSRDKGPILPAPAWSRP